MSTTPEIFANWSRYNRWMNQRIYAASAELTDAERKRDRGAFFKSIHGTLNHILLADRLWLGRFSGQPYETTTIDGELYADFDTLRAQRAITDDAADAWVATLTPQSLAAEFNFETIVSPGRKRCVLWHAATHFFNHQTHHRGQVTTLLMQAGVDPGVTDLMWLPGMLEFVDVE